MTRINLGFTFHLMFYAMQIFLIGSLPVMKCIVFNTIRKQNDKSCSGKHRIHFDQKTRISRSQVKNMLVCFFDHKRTVHYEVIAQGQTINQRYYLEVLPGIKESVGRKRPGICPDMWNLHHENVPVHNALRFREFLP